MRTLLPALAFPLALAVAPAQALEPFKIYDGYSDRQIDPARWSDHEKVREIKGGAMRPMRTYGLGNSDAGATPTNWHSNLAPVAPSLAELKATITVTALETNGCPSNPAVGDARARIMGSFFNTVATTGGTQLDDAIAQVRLYRASNSADPAGLLRVQGILSICTTADCNATTIVGNIVDLGTGDPVGRARRDLLLLARGRGRRHRGLRGERRRLPEPAVPPGFHAPPRAELPVGAEGQRPGRRPVRQRLHEPVLGALTS